MLHTTPRFNAAALTLLASAMLLAGCATGPDYQRPAVDTPTAFKETAEGQWKAAEPAESVPRGEWWKVFRDPTLDALQTQAAEANQDLKAALARVAQARATQRDARAAYFPQIDVGAGPTRQRSSPASRGLEAGADSDPFTLWRAQATVSYEVDLFGRIGRTVDAATAAGDQQEALFHSMQLAVQADVAQTYFTVRELDALAELYAETVRLRERSAGLMQRRFDEGYVSELEVARTRTELATARSEQVGVARLRAAAEHSLAILLGQAPAAFSLAPRPLDHATVRVPSGLPSALLERRPDIAAAERAMAAANARVGAARAAFFPSLTLTGTLGYESAELGDLFKWSSRAFVLGPVVGTMLSLPIFDGGAREARLDRATAAYHEEVATYRQTVLRAFKDVEDNLAHLRLLDEQMRAQDDAVRSSRRAADLSQTQYREGSISHLGVIDADRSVLQQQRVAVQLGAEQARATVALIRALGGGWDVAQATP
ncbi:efflux transporter outer membrane subunit [Propionivibrio soli]|uniref:efflux transporter outer membrane subunit n=1 Tax=Propionivibrio soli TaxID=2976531 RepID=UPI0021E99C65|nr:efflux transporter outer membrane subunit [Propionivibrio soli]